MLVIGVLLVSGVLLVRRAQQPASPDDAGNRLTAQLNMETLIVALDLLREDIGRFPTAEEGLVALVHDPGLPGWDGPYVLELKPDPWGHRFAYEPVSNAVKVISRGPDRERGTARDVIVTGRAGAAYQPVKLWMER